MTDYPYSVHVIESPSAIDLLERRQEREALHRALRHTGLGIEDYLVVNKRALGRALVRVLRSPERASRRRTVIHLSAHGTPHGVELTSGELIGWAQLAEAFRHVNQLAAGRLLLGMSTCHGLHALKMISPRDELPFGTLVGPTKDLLWGDSVVAFLAFYHLVIYKGVAVDRAAAAMNTAAGLPRGFFAAVDGDHARRRLTAQDRLRSLASLRRLLARA